MNFNKLPVEYTQFDKNPLSIPGDMNFGKEAVKHFSQFENHIDEYNLPRINDFLKSKGLDTDYSVFVLSQEDYENEENQNPHILLRWESHSTGEKLSLSRVLIVKKDGEFEDHSGKLFTEGSIIHEIAHRNSLDLFQTTMPAINQRNITTVREGLALKKSESGYILEESFAALVQKEYIEKYAGESDFYNNLNVNVQSANGMIKISTDQYNTPFDIHFCFLVKRKSGMTFTTPGVAFSLLSRLIQKNPKIYTEIYNSRHSVDGIRMFIQEVEKIQKGLYVKIRNTPYDTMEMLKLLDWMKENDL
jgi:hypothetical protein